MAIDQVGATDKMTAHRDKHNEEIVEINALRTEVDSHESDINTLQSDLSTESTNRSTGDNTNAANLNTHIADTTIHAPNTSFMSRQAIINGNFDVWQRGITATNPANFSFLADRWFVQFDTNGGTNPTIVTTRQTHTPGTIPGAYYYYNLNTNGAGSNYGSTSYYTINNKIENGTRTLCGDGRKLTLSFWAGSNIAGKRIVPVLWQGYGTGGSPTTVEGIVGSQITLTSSFTKYEQTFTMNTLTGKTFGTANNDYLQISLYLEWGSGAGIGTTDTFVGSGNIYFSQAQLCAGDAALSFQPNRFADELRLCQRYYEKSYNQGVNPGTATDVGSFQFQGGSNIANHQISPWIPFKVTKAITPTTITLYDESGNASKVGVITYDGVTTTQNSAYTGLNRQSASGFGFYIASTTNGGVVCQWTAEAEL